MLNFFKWFNENKNKLHPFELATLVHAKLTWIHPIEDGKITAYNYIGTYQLNDGELVFHVFEEN